MTTSNAVNINDDGLQDFDSSTGDFTAIDLTTKGDLLAHTGSAYQRFGVGTDGYVLKADSSQPVGLRWACTGFEFIETQSASDSSSIEFTNFADSDCFSGYRLVWNSAYRRDEDFNLRIRLSTDNGSSWLTSGYKYIRDSIRTDTADEIFPYSASADSIWLNGSSGVVNRMSLNGEGFFYPSLNPGTTLANGFTYTSTNEGDQVQFLTSRGYGINTTSSAINGFQFTFDTGNITSGTFTLWGVLL